MEEAAVESHIGPILGVPRGVLAAVLTMVSRASNECCLGLNLDSLLGKVQSPVPSFNEGENENVIALGSC